MFRRIYYKENIYEVYEYSLLDIKDIDIIYFVVYDIVDISVVFGARGDR